MNSFLPSALPRVAGNLPSAPVTKPHIGVLALQGAFREHRQRLESLGVAVTEVRLPQDLQGLAGVVMPGGESTTMARLLTEFKLWEPLKDFYLEGGALWGTCAGAILLADHVLGAPPQFGGKQDSLKLLNATVKRNAFGRQIDSFKTMLPVKGFKAPYEAVFIRAPAFSDVGENVQILAEFEHQAVMLRQGRILATTFHPELTLDIGLHQYFLNEVVPK